MTNYNRPAVFIYSLREAREHLRRVTDAIDSDDRYSFVILETINNTIMHDEMCNGLTDAVQDLVNGGVSSDVAFSICNDATDLIISNLCELVPDFNDHRYSRQYRWELKENCDVVLTIEPVAYQGD